MRKPRPIPPPLKTSRPPTPTDNAFENEYVDTLSADKTFFEQHFVAILLLIAFCLLMLILLVLLAFFTSRMVATNQNSPATTNEVENDDEKPENEPKSQGAKGSQDDNSKDGGTNGGAAGEGDGDKDGGDQGADGSTQNGSGGGEESSGENTGGGSSPFNDADGNSGGGIGSNASGVSGANVESPKDPFGSGHITPPAQLDRRAAKTYITSCFGVTSKGRNVLFIVDATSGFSPGQFHRITKEVAKSIGVLDRRQPFEVVFVSDRLHSLDKELRFRPATDSNKEKAMYWIDDFQQVEEAFDAGQVARLLARDVDVIHLLANSRMSAAEAVRGGSSIVNVVTFSNSPTKLALKGLVINGGKFTELKNE